MADENPFAHLIASLGWQRQRVENLIRRWMIFRGARGTVSWRWPWPFQKPWQRARLRLCSHGGGIGDELMCTPIFREIRRLNPRCHITFLSRHQDVFERNPHLSAVERFTPAAAANAIYLQYNLVLPPPRPLVTLMAECVGLNLSASHLEPPIIDPSGSIQARIAEVPEPRILIQPQASRWTPNKQWPFASWTRLVEMLVERYHVIEVGTQSMFPQQQFGPRFHSFAGETTMQDFIWMISQAAVFVGPVSGGMHIANAYKIPSVVLFGGYEAPDGFDYPFAHRFFTPVDCAPCWLTTPCPFELKCLHAIHPDAVSRAVVRAVETNASRKLAEA